VTSVTPLRPVKAKRADNTAALRQRRSRAKRKSSVTAPASKPADDFTMLWLLFRTFLPQVGGLVLMLAVTSARR
jgi:hypothetical protein